MARPVPTLHVPPQPLLVPNTTEQPPSSSSTDPATQSSITTTQTDAAKAASLAAHAAPHLGPAITPAQELLTEHLGFPPIQYVDDIINAVNDVSYNGIQACEKFVLDVMKLDEEEAEKGLAATETLFENNIDKQFDNFELYVFRNILNIPENLPITLPHHQALDAVITEEEDAAMNAELEELRQKLRAAKYWMARVRHQTGELRKRRPALEKLINETKRLLDLAEKRDGPPLSESAQTILTQLTQTHTLRHALQLQTSDVSFTDVLNRKRKEGKEDEAHLQSAIAAAIERRREQVVVSATPRRNRRSGIGIGLQTPGRGGAGGGSGSGGGQEMSEYAAEWKDRMAVGTLVDLQSWMSTPGSSPLDDPMET
ncbi:hypothetical protein HDV00_010196 [Rhizophlyctis rosea]|nr:hypothetical protein HDV00_010196 [Rhizophlyctis rosea]